MVSKCTSRHEHPRYVLYQISKYKEQCRLICFLHYKIDHVKERKDACPPYERVTECADSFTHIICHRVAIVKYRTDHRRPFIPGGRIRMCRFQLGMVTVHRFLIIDHPRKQTVCRSIVKRNVRTQIDQSRNHDKEYDTGTDCLKKITLKDIYNMPVRDRSGTSARIVARPAVFHISVKHDRRKEYSQSCCRINCRPFAGTTESHHQTA